jgi:hypothetical protein
MAMVIMILGTRTCIGTIMIRIATERLSILAILALIGVGILTVVGILVGAGRILGITPGIPIHFAILDMVGTEMDIIIVTQMVIIMDTIMASLMLDIITVMMQTVDSIMVIGMGMA